jgi:hypothetical protein
VCFISLAVLLTVSHSQLRSYKEYREKQEKLHQDWLKKKEERDEKIARGEKVGKLEPDPTAVEEVGLLGLLKFLLYVAIFFVLAGKFFTGSFIWEYEGKWTNLKTYWPVCSIPCVSYSAALIFVQSQQLLYSEHMLATFDGTNPGKPIYLAVNIACLCQIKPLTFRNVDRWGCLRCF